MAWNKKHAEARRLKGQTNPEYRAKRNAQSAPNKEARAEYMREYYAANPEKFKRITPEQRERRNAARRKKYAESVGVRELAKAAVKAWQEGNPHKRKAQRLKQYGIALSDFEDMMAMQKGRCAICGFEDTESPKLFPMVDHCHKTGRVRGLLCMSCNQGLGKFKDDVNLLMTAAAYLAKHG